HAQTFVGVGRRYLAEIGGQDGAVGSDFADVGVDLLPGDLAGIRRGEAAFEVHAESGKLLLLVDAQQRGRELRMRDDDALHPDLLRGAYDGQDFRRSDMAGRQDHVVFGDDLEALASSLRYFAVFRHAQERAGDAERAHLAG